MKRKDLVAGVLLLTLGACRRPDGIARSTRQQHPSPRPLRRAIDPTSIEAAQQLLQGFVDLLNRRDFDGAYMLLGAGAPRRADFDSQFARLSKLRVSAGHPGDQEGAAGSIYLSAPLNIAGDTGGKRVSRSATLVLRRVNDVPGSTEAQRRWHIERIDWKDPA